MLFCKIKPHINSHSQKNHMINLIIKTYQRWTQFFRNMRLISVLNVKGFEDLTEMLETVYPGFKAHLSKLVDRHERNMIEHCFDYINANGGVERLTNYYNELDEEGKGNFHANVGKMFRDGYAFESQAMFLDKVSRMKGYDMLGQLMCDLKDGIVMSSIKSGKRTVDDWRIFLRREQECGNDIRLGVLDEIEQSQKINAAQNGDESNAVKSIPDIPLKVISHIYEKYNDVIFKKISTPIEFQNIILRQPHSKRLVECKGRRILMYHLLWRFHNMLPTNDQSQWLEDICSECGYSTKTLSKKYTDNNTMRKENREIFEQLSEYFDLQEKASN